MKDRGSEETRVQSDLLRDGEGKRAFSGLLFHLRVCVSWRAKVNHIGPSSARGKQHGRFGVGGGSESWLREDTRGALAPLWVSMVAAVVPLLLSRHLSLIFLSIFLLSDCVLSSRPSNRPPAPIKNKTDVATEC